jgi:fibronectin type 3 domain-containing protein
MGITGPSFLTFNGQEVQLSRTSGNDGGNNGGGDNTDGDDNTGGGTAVAKPGVPTGVKATAQSSTTIRISWNVVSGATSYKVYYGIASYSSFTQLIGTPTTTYYDDTECDPGETAYYKVSAVNSAGESALSSYAYAKTPSSSGGGNTGGGGTTVTKPNAPYGGIIIKAHTPTSTTLEWGSVSNATKYNLYRASSTSPNQFSKVYSGTATTYADTGVNSALTYYYKVTAENSAGESDYSAVKEWMPY